MFLNKFVSEKCRCLDYHDRENKYGVLNGDNIKTRKYNEKKDKNVRAASSKLNITVLPI